MTSVASGAACAAVLLCMAGSAAGQQRCDNKAYPLSSGTARFEDHADGTVTDKESRLMWMRCSAGQAWAGTACAGQAVALPWPAASALADSVNQSGQFFFDDWRVPQLRELATIAERECANPRINLAVFPGTPAAPYWSATSRPADGSGFAYALGFGLGGVQYVDKAATHHVRLVRHAQ